MGSLLVCQVADHPVVPDESDRNVRLEWLEPSPNSPSLVASVAERSDRLAVSRPFCSRENPCAPVLGADSQIDIHRIGARYEFLGNTAPQASLNEPRVSIGHLFHLLVPGCREKDADGNL